MEMKTVGKNGNYATFAEAVADNQFNLKMITDCDETEKISISKGNVSSLKGL